MVNKFDAESDLDERLTNLFKSVESSPVMVMICDSLGVIEKVNRKLCTVTGYQPEELIGNNISTLGYIDVSTMKEIRKRLGSGAEWSGKICSKKKDGDEFWEESSIFPIQDSEGLTTHFVKVAEDITLRRNTEDAIRFLAFYDNLTNLPNRRVFIDRLKFNINRNRRDRELLAVITVDLDDFKKVNNALGHVPGDQVLKVVSERFTECLRASDTVAHYSGDSFMILLSKVSHTDHVASVSEKLLGSLQTPIILHGQEIHLTASAGIALFPRDGEDVAVLLKHSSLALQRSKKFGGNCYHYFDPELHEAAMTRISMDGNLRRALRQREFILHYQPQFDCKTRELIGLEALVRWRDPDKGIIMPGDFIPLAEENGFIIPLTEWILRTACQQRKEWALLGIDSPRVAVNISPKQFLQRDLPQFIDGILRDARLPASLLELEVTEHTLTTDVDTAKKTLNALKDMGISISIDDFGTGYSSLSQLHTFPINMLKIDRSFVGNLGNDSSNPAIVAAVIAMAHEIGLKVIAEGVETVEQEQFLQRNGCDYLQGFLYGRPMDADEISRLFAAGK